MLACSHDILYSKYVHTREILKLTNAIEERFGTLGKSQGYDTASADIQLEMESTCLHNLYMSAGLVVQISIHV